MLKYLLVVSLCLNVIGFSFVVKRLYYQYKIAPGLDLNGSKYHAARSQLFAAIPGDTSDIILLGTSLTEGFPTELLHRPHVKNRGIRGDIMANISKRTASTILKRPSKLFLEGGINDIKGNTPIADIVAHIESIIRLVNTQSPNTVLFINSILPITDGVFGSGATIRGMNHDIAACNKLLEGICQKYNIHFLNLYPLFEQQGRIKPDLTYDGVHLTSKGYTVWQTYLTPYLN